MMGFYCAGNWKMHKNAEQAAHFIKHLKMEGPHSPEEQKQMIVLPPALVAWTVATELKGSHYAWGAQNAYYSSEGAFTGENSPLILKEMGAQYCVVGHSERRHIFAEPDELLAKKAQGIQKHGMTPIVCVGETSDDRRWGRTREVIVRQLRAALQLVDPTGPLWLAYEPVWAIGTGLIANALQVEEAHAFLRKALGEWNSTVSDRVPILYGGSVKADNANSLASLNNVNGFLIGGASLDASEFIKIYKMAKEARPN